MMSDPLSRFLCVRSSAFTRSGSVTIAPVTVDVSLTALRPAHIRARPGCVRSSAFTRPSDRLKVHFPTSPSIAPIPLTVGRRCCAAQIWGRAAALPYHSGGVKHG